ncbi:MULTISPECIES: DUF4386 domain-containing protein [unclassified Nocardiopsis]|uniref:DUF4386 domain-containing protein n=1 Tax=unclassified Nocardiopsis TaxID=2649073 RepID=UPI001358AE8C|nr:MULTISPECIES: DUF4386 domain-containing protein [unclassified Nocardiopsis]
MTVSAPDTAAPRLARATGALLLVMAVSALCAEAIRSSLVVPGDALATAERIQASPELFRFGFLGYLLAFLCDVPVAVLLYVLLRPVNRTWALLAASFRLVYTAVVSAFLLHYAQAALLLEGEDHLSALGPDQAHALVSFHLDVFSLGFGAALVFFGVHLVLLGPLLRRSGLVPALLGVLVGLGGLAYVLDGVLLFAWPVLQANASPVLAMLGFSELLLALWLVVRGVRPVPAETARSA